MVIDQRRQQTANDFQKKGTEKYIRFKTQRRIANLRKKKKSRTTGVI